MALSRWNWFSNDPNARSSANQDQKGQSLTQSGLFPFPMPSSYFGPLSQFYQDMDRMMESTFRNLSRFSLPHLFSNNNETLPAFPGIAELPGFMFRPNINIASTDQEYTITAEVPGMAEEDITLELSPDGTLTLSGEKKQQSEKHAQHLHCMECAYGVFQRTLSLPEEADKERIKASFANGILTITVPMKQSTAPSEPTKHIPIQGAKGTSQQSSSTKENTKDKDKGHSGGEHPHKAA